MSMIQIVNYVSKIYYKYARYLKEVHVKVNSID